MSSPYEFLVGKEPIKKERRCPKCGSEPDYWNSSMCSLCRYKGKYEDFKEIQIATVNWEKLAKELK